MTRQQKIERLNKLLEVINTSLSEAENLADQAGVDFTIRSHRGFYQTYVGSDKEEFVCSRQQAINELASNVVLYAERIKFLREVLANTTNPEDEYTVLLDEEGYWYNSSADC